MTSLLTILNVHSLFPYLILHFNLFDDNNSNSIDVDDNDYVGKIQPWSDFFTGFKPPQPDKKYIEQRISTNFVHFRSNYIIINCIITFIIFLFSPLLLFILLLYFCATFYFLFVMKPAHIQIGELSITSKGKRYISIGVLLVILLLTGGLQKLAWIALYTFVIISLHAIFKPRNIQTGSSSSSASTLSNSNIKFNGINWPGSNAKTKKDAGGISSGHDPENPPITTDDDSSTMSSGSSYGVSSDHMTKRTTSRVA